MGSSCHLKGAYDVVKKIKELDIKNLKLYGSLCFGKCESGINIEIDGELVSHVSPENVQEIVKKFMKER